MKKFILLLIGLAFAVSAVSQSTLPTPGNPRITEWRDQEPIVIDSEMYVTDMTAGYTLAYDGYQHPVADDNTTLLDPEKVTFSLFTDNDNIFTFTPEMFDQVDVPTTRFPFTSIHPNGNVGWWMITFGDFGGLTNHVDILAENGIEVDPFFTWRIGIQTQYTDGDLTTTSDIVYMEIYPQLKEAANVTSTSFLADWSCEAENTYLINNFIGAGCGYFLHVIDKATQEEVLVQNVEPTNAIVDEDGKALEFQIPGAFYTVEGLMPGNTYQYYVEVIQNTGASFNSVVREVTLPAADVYIMGEINDQNWAANVGTLMTYDAENKIYTATVNLNASETFGFTTELAEYNDDGSWAYIEPYRFGPPSVGDFVMEDQYLGQELTLTFDNYGAIKMLGADEYKITVSLEENYIKVEKANPEPPAYLRGDVDDDGDVDIDDVTRLIDVVLGKDVTYNAAAADCNTETGDGSVDIDDVTALINRVLTGSWD